MPPDWYYTTSNDAKLREVQHVFGGSPKVGHLRIPVMAILEVELEKQGDAWKISKLAEGV